MIPKNNRFYISEWFDKKKEFKDGDVVVFDMPPFCSGDYSAKVYIDNDGDPYIKRSLNFYDGCRDLYITKK